MTKAMEPAGGVRKGSARGVGEILLVDQVPDHRLLLRMELQSAGYEVLSLDAFGVATQLVRLRLRRSQPFAAILLDVPGGARLIEAARADGYCLPVIGMGLDERDAPPGCDAYLLKPVRASHVLEVLRSGR